MKKRTVIKYFGTQSAVARALGCSPAAISLWGDVIPKGAAYQLEVVTQGGLTVDPKMYPKAKKASAA